MAIKEAFADLREQVLSEWLRQPLSSSHVAEEVSACAELHHEAKVVHSFKGVVKFHDVLVRHQVLEDLYFLSHSFLAFIKAS